MSDLPGRESSWPEPGLLGIRGLVEVAQRGQAERHEDVLPLLMTYNLSLMNTYDLYSYCQDFHFWEQATQAPLGSLRGLRPSCRWRRERWHFVTSWTLARALGTC